MGNSRSSFPAKCPQTSHSAREVRPGRQFPSRLPNGERPGSKLCPNTKRWEDSLSGSDALILSLQDSGLRLCVSTRGHRVLVGGAWRLGRLRLQHREKNQLIHSSTWPPRTFPHLREITRGKVEHFRRQTDTRRNSQRAKRPQLQTLVQRPRNFLHLLTGFGGVCFFPLLARAPANVSNNQGPERRKPARMREPEAGVWEVLRKVGRRRGVCQLLLCLLRRSFASD